MNLRAYASCLVGIIGDVLLPDHMGKGRTNRSEYAKGPFVNITARIPLDVWTTIDHYAQKHTGGNRSLAVERMIRQCEAHWNDWRALGEKEQDRRSRIASQRNNPGRDSPEEDA